MNISSQFETNFAEVEALQRAGQIAADAHNEYMLSHRQRLETKLRELETRCSDLQETGITMKMENEAERERLEAGRKEVRGEIVLLLYPLHYCFQPIIIVFSQIVDAFLN